MKTKKDFYKFVNINKHNIRKFGNNVGKNCIGTALYLVGELPEEKFVYGEQTDSILKNLKEDNVPNLGNLVAWQDGNGETYHLAVVVKTNPTLLAHRYRFNSGFF